MNNITLTTLHEHLILSDNPNVIRFLWKLRRGQDNRLRYQRIRYMIKELREVKSKYEGKRAVYVV